MKIALKPSHRTYPKQAFHLSLHFALAVVFAVGCAALLAAEPVIIKVICNILGLEIWNKNTYLVQMTGLNDLPGLKEQWSFCFLRFYFPGYAYVLFHLASVEKSFLLRSA